ncbi:hypothetical protein CH371_15315 [Leptospira wolffii]|uniref:Uncharacterized protein n=1 Tax=Leptospira wolffii TaxID=409998 RepID=A0A2M9Z8X4_9LEPT|nr:hypothetical protein [Leptospira wolffii]PJZ64876.1 hypothetical protein CH371_15315 [Leptospira wolffii]
MYSRIRFLKLLFIPIFFSLYCVSEIVRDSPDQGFYRCIGEDSSNIQVAELARRVALRKDPRMNTWTKPSCEIRYLSDGEEWLVLFFRHDDVPDDVLILHGAESISVLISAKDMRIKTVSSNVRY